MEKTAKKESLAAFHRGQILDAAEQVFSQKGFDATTIDDISTQSAYSRRTIYAYFIDKHDILYHTSLRGLTTLRANIEETLKNEQSFFARSRALFAHLHAFYTQYPYSSGAMERASCTALDAQTETIRSILTEGGNINTLLVRYLDDGQKEGTVQAGIQSLSAVFVLTTSLAALQELIRTKGAFICSAAHTTEEDFWKTGCRQLLRGIIADNISVEKEL